MCASELSIANFVETQTANCTEHRMQPALRLDDKLLLGYEVGRLI